MKLNIEVEASSFEKVIKDGLESLSKKELADILKQVILEAFNKNPNLNGALIEVSGDYYNKKVKLGPLAEAAVKEIKKAMLDDLKNNYMEILAEAILKNLIDNFMMATAFSGMMESRMKQTVEEIIHRSQS